MIVDLYTSLAYDMHLAVLTRTKPHSIPAIAFQFPELASVKLYLRAFEFDPLQGFETVNATRIADDIRNQGWAVY